MTPGPDVTPVGFAATDAPDALARRVRNPVWLVLAIVLAAAGLGGIVRFVLVQVDRAPGPDEAVAEGRVAARDGPATPAVRFAGEGHYTVWLDLGGVRNANNRETVVAATNCVARFANESSVSFRGARQGASVTIGGRATVGTFEAPGGVVALACHQRPFGRFGHVRRLLGVERPLFVTAGRPGADLVHWAGLFGGSAMLLLAVPAFGRWRTGALRVRRGRTWS